MVPVQTVSNRRRPGRRGSFRPGHREPDQTMRRDFVWPTVNQISNFRRPYEAIWRRGGKVLTIVCAPARPGIGSRCNLNFTPYWNEAAALTQSFAGAARPPGTLTLGPRSCVQSRARGPGSLAQVGATPGGTENARGNDGGQLGQGPPGTSRHQVKDRS